jgi:uncharacterized protein (TIGR02246 family)
MKKLRIKFCLFLVALIGLNTGACKPKTSHELSSEQRSALIDTILQVTDDLADAISKRDLQRIKSSFAVSPYCKYISDGLVIPGDSIVSVLGAFYSGLSNLDFAWTRKDIELISSNVATVTSWTSYTATTLQNQQITEKAVFTLLFIRQDGKWRVLSSHKSIQKT